MGETRHRTQILLEREQYIELRNISREEKRSISDLVRESVEQYLGRRMQEGRHRRQKEALERAARVRAAGTKERGGKALDIDVAGLIRNLRAEGDARFPAVSRQGHP